MTLATDSIDTTMNFWQLNKKLLTTTAFSLFAIWILIGYNTDPDMKWFNLLFTLPFIFIAFFGYFCLPSIQIFRAIRLFTENNSENAILPLLDPGYTISYENERSWFVFTRPFISATIDGWPVKIYYEGPSRYSSRRIFFLFSPLALAGSKRIYREGFTSRLDMQKRLEKDIKPDIINCLATIKAKGYVSGVGRKISTKHVDVYEE